MAKRAGRRRSGLRNAAARHESYQAKCMRCMGIRRRMRELRRLTFTQQVHFEANEDYFEDVDGIEFRYFHAFNYRGDDELSDATKARVCYVGAVAMQESESLVEVLAKDVAAVGCPSRAPEVLHVGSYKVWNKSEEAGELLQDRLLDDVLYTIGDEYDWVRRRDKELPGDEYEWDENDSEDVDAAVKRNRAFLRNLELSVENLIFFLNECYEIGDFEWCGKLPVVWLQSADSECCTFLTGCKAAVGIGARHRVGSAMSGQIARG